MTLTSEEKKALRAFPTLPDHETLRVIGHRGSCGTTPENTLASFQQAVRDRADVIEMDVHCTSDDQVVVCHDPTVNRTTNGFGAIASKTLAELRELDAGYNFTEDGGKSFPFRGEGICIPTFEEVLSAFPSTPINVEIKVDNPVLVQKFLQLLWRYGRLQASAPFVIVAAQSTKLIKKIRVQAPQLRTGHSYGEILRFLTLSRLHCPGLFNPPSPALQIPDRTSWLKVATPALVRDAHRLGLEVHVWTINEEPEMQKYLDLGVDALFTDFPGRLRKLVDARLKAGKV